MSKLKFPTSPLASSSSPTTGNPLWYDQTVMVTEDLRADNAAALLLDRPRRTVAWGKLSDCFCVRGGGPTSKKRLDDHPRSTNKKGDYNYYSNNNQKNVQHGYQENDCPRPYQQQNPFVPALGGFSNLPGVLRRHSSLTLTSGVVGEEIEDCIPNDLEQRGPQNHRGRHHHSDRHADSGSLSDFTQSETSSYLSFSDDEDEDDGGEVLVLRPRIQGLNHRGVPSPPGPNESYSREVARSAPMMPAPVGVGVGGAFGGSSIGNSTISSSSAADKQSLPLSKTPPNQRITRPPAIGTRSRSAGLPPLNPSSSFGGGGGANTSLLLASQEPSFSRRQRADTGEFTRTSGTTNTSRHRRKDPFTFSDRSITEIWHGNGGGERTDGQRGAGEMPTPAPPPSYVTFPHDPRWPENGIPNINFGPSPMAALRKRRDDGPGNDVVATGWTESFASSFDASEEQRMYVGLAAPPADVGEHGDENSGSPFAGLERKVEVGKLEGLLPNPPSLISPGNDPSGDNNCSTLYSPHADQRHRQQQVPSPNGMEKRIQHNDPAPLEDFLTGYLRKNRKLDASTKGQLILSGWVAILFGTSADNFRSMKQEEGGIYGLSSEDVYYLRVVVVDGQPSLLLNKSNNTGSFDQSYTIERDWVIESWEVARHIGRAIIIHRGASTTTTTMTTPSSLLMLPIALTDCYFTEAGVLISEERFHRLRDKLFARPNDFAPDEQLDSAMYLVFSIDSLVKQYGCP
jgi:hypothetical protein